MKRLLTIGALLCSLGVVVVGCRSYTYKLQQGSPENNRLGLNFAHEDRMEKRIDSMYKPSLPQYLELIDKNGVKQTLVNSYQEEDGTSTPLFELKGITVESRLRNIPERNGRIDMDFVITVPKTLIDKRWQLRIYPRAFKQEGTRLDLDPVVLSGADFLKMQKDGYDQYKRFVASIIPDSLYWKEMIDQKGVKKALADLEQDYYNAWKKDMLVKDEWIDWRDKINKRYLLFNKKMERNKASIDSTSVLAILPAYWLERQLNKRVVPTTFAEFAWGSKEIMKKKITPEDSLEIERKYTNIRKIAENERKKEQQQAMFDKMVRFPKIAARLDTIIEGGDVFKYYYIQELDTDKETKRIKLVLNGEVVAVDMSTYEVPRSDSLTYYVSSMVDFLDETPRYKTKVVYRNENKSFFAKIAFKQGSSVVDIKLGENATELEKVVDFARDIEKIGDVVLDSLTMIGYASPEGSAHMNRVLSEKRTSELKRYVTNHRIFERLPRIRSVAGGENWSGLLHWMQDSVHGISPMTLQRAQEMVRREPNEDRREIALKEMLGSQYLRIKEECYPTLRTTEFRFYVHRPNMLKDTIHTSVIDERYNEGRELLRQRDYSKALGILSDYPNDFNLGICQMSLGYNKGALATLMASRKEKDADLLYLLAILQMREGDVKSALSSLLASVEKDSRKVFRAQLDPELNKLIKQYGLFKEQLDF